MSYMRDASGVRLDTINVQAILRPSGDATGATDIAAINASLLANRVTILTGGTFTINAPIRQPSNTTLILNEATVFLAAGSNCNLWQNYNQNSSGDTNITVRGLGRALFNGNATNQARQSIAKTDGTGGTSLYPNVGIYPVQVNGLRIQDIQIGPTNAYAFWCAGVNNAHLSRIRLEQDKSTTNQDGIDIGPGCNNILVENITGVSGDDALAIHSVTWWGPSVADANPPLYQANGAAPNGRATTYITYRNIQVDAGVNLLRLMADSVSPLSFVEGSDMRNLSANGSGVLQVGSWTYIASSKYASAAQCTDLTFNGLSGGARFGSRAPISVDGNCQRLHVRGLDVQGKQWPVALVGTGANLYSPTVLDLLVDGVKAAAAGGATTVGHIMSFRSGSVVTKAQLSNIEVAECNSVLANAGTVTDLTLKNVRTNKADAIPFASTVAETGWFDDVRVDTLSGVTATYGTTALVAKLSRSPVLTSADTTPSAATKGSRIVCDHTKDPTGGAGTTGGEYIANGSAWVKVVDLGVSF